MDMAHDLNTKIDWLVQLGQYMQSEDPDWQATKERAVIANPWFTPEHIDMAVDRIAGTFLQREALSSWLAAYPIPERQVTVGIVMAGNIPLVGFHDFLCGYLSGHRLMLKLSSKDEVLLRQLLRKLGEWDTGLAEQVQLADMLKGCDAYIATGSNNSARYFEQYFAKYPHIIRKNRTSVAMLDGTETAEELAGLGRDIFSYFGLGCRNVTQLCVPEEYDFTPLLQVLERYGDFMHHHKYRNNYDYHLALYLLNKVPHLNNGSLLLVENALPFSAVSVVHYRYYQSKAAVLSELQESQEVQAIVGHGLVPFGEAQCPALNDYADGVDTMAFLCSL